MYRPADKFTARRFLADWYGFQFEKIHVRNLRVDREGNAVSIQFSVRSFARGEYLARRRPGSDEWELILLP